MMLHREPEAWVFRGLFLYGRSLAVERHRRWGSLGPAGEDGGSDEPCPPEQSPGRIRADTEKTPIPTVRNQEGNKWKTRWFFFFFLPPLGLPLSVNTYRPEPGAISSVGDSHIILAPGAFYLHNCSLGKFLHFSAETLALLLTPSTNSYFPSVAHIPKK